LWEKEHDGRLVDGKNYQRLSLTTYATHDHPPLRVLWESLEADARAGNGHALYEMRILAEFARITTPVPAPYSEEIQMALLEALLRSNSWIAVMMITDLFGSDQRFNVPGAISDANWSERLPDPVSHWGRNANIAHKAAAMHALLLATGRHAE
jgi:4-alpha-glucanotransferase